jgi:hypothetical protein
MINNKTPNFNHISELFEIKKGVAKQKSFESDIT